MVVKVKESNSGPTNETNKKSKLTRKQVVNTICIILLSGVLVCSVLGFSVLQGILNGSELVSGIDGLEAKNSSRIYDNKGNLITTLSGESGIRENIKYKQVPQVVIDAFLSIEDSRYYKHNGFDLPRFIKSAFNNLSEGGLNQGGSTLTMQLVDVALFTDQDKENASTTQKIEQKVQEIFKSMEIESQLSKEKILENYLNMINFGGPARGIQKGAQYYFGKNVEDLNLSEAAFLAGVINAPTTFNPYNMVVTDDNGNTINYYANAVKRRNEVLYMMNYHGYITDEEYELAKSSELSFQLNGETNFDTEQYKAYIDYVIEEVKEKTGDNPYTTPMDIYTTMDKDAQELSDQMCNGEGVAYPDERFQVGFAAIDNQSGAVLALGGGRSYNGDRNRASVDSHQPGSTAKPIVDYAEAFEYLGYSTEHVIEDGPVNYSNGQTLYNADRKFRGDVTLKQAIGMSLNVPAYKTCVAVIEKIGLNKELEILSDMGIDIKKSEWSYAMSIGGGNFYVTPLQWAGAYTVFANKGNYNEPYSVRSVKYQSKDKSTYKHKKHETEVFSEETAYLTSYMLEDAVEGGYGMMSEILIGNYKVYAKTGTTDYGEEALQYGYPEGVAKDKWLVAYTNKFTIATWAGYDQAVVGQANYLDQYKLYLNIEGNITNQLLDLLVANDGNNDTEIKKPGGVVSVKHIQGLFPYATAQNNDGALMVTGLIRSSFSKDIHTVEPDSLDAPSEINASQESNGEIKIEMPLYKDESKRTVASKTKTMSAGGITVTGKRIFDKSFLFGAVTSAVEIKVNGESKGTFKFDGSSTTEDVECSKGDQIEVIGYYTYTNASTKSGSKSVSFTANHNSGGNSDVESYTIGNDFEDVFTNSYSASRSNVESFLETYCTEAYHNNQFIIAKSSSVASGKYDSNHSTVGPNVTVEVGDKKYYIYIGQ